MSGGKKRALAISLRFHLMSIAFELEIEGGQTDANDPRGDIGVAEGSRGALTPERFTAIYSA